MEPLKLPNAEYRLMEIVWANEPVNSTKLARLCAEKLGWKKSTTYTVLHNLGDRGVLQNNKATVRSLVRKEQVLQYRSTELIDRDFGGSLPLLIATFLHSRRISKEEAAQIRRLIEEASR